MFNKVYSQIASDEYVPNGMKDIRTALNMAAHSFYSTWFAFGSFEKGELFKLPNVVATTNVNPENLKNYEQHDQFKTNVLPFSPTLTQISHKDEDYKTKVTFGQNSRVVSYVLAEHPLKKLIDEVIKLDWPKDEPTSKTKNQNSNARPSADKWLSDKLKITAAQAKNAIEVEKALGARNKSECERLSDEMSSIFKSTSLAKTALQTAIKNKFPE